MRRPTARVLSTVDRRYAPHLAVASMGYVFFGYAAVPATLRARLDVDFAGFGLLMSAALAALVVAQVPASRLGDRYPAPTLLFVGTAAHAVLAVVMDLATTFEALLALRFLWALAGGFLLSVGAAQVARTFEGAAVTRQQGVYGGMLTLGGAVGFLTTPRLVAAAAAGRPVVPLPGAGVHAVGAVLALPALALLWRARTGRPSAVGDEAGDGGTTSVLRDRTVQVAALVYVAIIGSYITLSTFVTGYYADAGVTAPLNVLVLLTATAGRAAGGVAVGGRLGDVSLVGLATAVAALGFAALALGPGRAVLLALPPLAMLAVSVPFGATFAVAADATDREGAAVAVVFAVGNLAALALPPAVGALRDATGDFGGGFALLAAMNLGALVAVGSLRRGGGGSP